VIQIAKEDIFWKVRSKFAVIKYAKPVMVEIFPIVNHVTLLIYFILQLAIYHAQMGHLEILSLKIQIVYPALMSQIVSIAPMDWKGIVKFA